VGGGVGVFSAAPTGLDEKGAAFFFAKLLMKNSRRERNMKAAPPSTRSPLLGGKVLPAARLPF
jgi:hypothetical protein